MARDLEDVVVDPWDASAVRRVPDPPPDDVVRAWCLTDVVRRHPCPDPPHRGDFDN